ncbi:1-deoxy-D-xylulose-5-phosphate synthase [Kitasatospora sp. NPDC001603]|uniref:1-deoxy-D-xylulose-5-phosphate synthase n=1 Tax=Kitasatospora sp. NPDC001603 TaxID=3154388 RepID=UPI00332BD105
MSPCELEALVPRIRELLVETVTAAEDALGPSLSAVELTLALHRVFESPRDRILWDTGHQAAVHKLLTRQAGGPEAIRRLAGLSGYPIRSESGHDIVENSHASTVLSWADGLARAHHLHHVSGRAVVAVMGAGALTGGMAWEAMNSLGSASQRPVVIVLNDNSGSAAPDRWAFTVHLAALRGPDAPQTLFESIGLAYLGPVDGHDITALETVLREAVELGRPVVVHCVTDKGRGYPKAERTARGVGRAPTEGVSGQADNDLSSWASVFGHELAHLATTRPDLVAVATGAIEPAGLGEFARRFPDRIVDVGPALQHAVTTAAGLALGGAHPVVTLNASSLNRAFDQVLLDVALHHTPVTFALNHAGVTGEGGAPGHGVWDLSLLNLVPGLRMAAPRDATTLRSALQEAVSYQRGPTALRFPKGRTVRAVRALSKLGGVDVLQASQRKDILLVSVGTMASTCLEAAGKVTARGLGITVVDPCWVKPLAPELISLAEQFRLVATVEENTLAGGVGTAIALALGEAGLQRPVRNFGIPQGFLEHGSRADTLAFSGLTAQYIADRLMNILQATAGLPRPPRTSPAPSTPPKGKPTRGFLTSS